MVTAPAAGLAPLVGTWMRGHRACQLRALTDATHGFFRLDLVGLLLGFFWAAPGLLLLSVSFWRLPFHSFLPFFMGGGASSSRPRGHRPRPTKVSGHVPRCVTASVGVSSAGPSLLWRGETRAIQCRVAQGTGSLEHPCLAGVIPCCCPKRAHLIAARSATCGRWSGGCLIERRRQTL